MQTPGSVTSRTNMVDSATARMSSAKTALNLEKVNKNLIQLRNEFRADIRDRGKFEEKRAKLLKKEETSLTGLRAATFNLRTIIGAASGASALRQFSQGNVGGGLQDTGIAVAAFIPEIIDITSKVVVGGLATKGLLGGGGVGGGMPKGKAGLLALPLLALAPLLMGAGNKNNNSPTAEFRREQGVRRTRKNIISSGDTDRFGRQLDRFERILDNMGGRKRPKSNINEKMELDLDGVDDTKNDNKDKKDINGQIADFLDLLNPFSSLGDIGKSDIQRKEDAKNRFAIFGTMFDGVKNFFGGNDKVEQEENGDGNIMPSVFSPISEEDAAAQIAREDLEDSFSDVGERLGNAAEKLSLDNEGPDFSSILGSQKGDKMNRLMKNFLGVIETEFLPLTKEEKLESMATNLMGSVYKSTPPIKKTALDDAPEFIQDIFMPIVQEGGIPSYQDDGALEETDSGVSDPSVDVEFRGSVDKFVNRLLLNINK